VRISLKLTDLGYISIQQFCSSPRVFL